MALTIDVTFKGINIPASYLTVSAPTIQSGNAQISFDVLFAAGPGLPMYSAEWYTCEYSLEGANPLEQAYEYLKTLPEYSGATDC